MQFGLGTLGSSGGAGGSAVAQGPTKFDPAFLSSTAALTNDNLTLSSTNNTQGTYLISRSVAGVTTGKFYCEMQVNNRNAGANTLQIGVIDGSVTAADSFLGVNTHGYAWFDGGNIVTNNAAVQAVAASTSAGDFIGMAFDAGAKLLWIRVNGGTWNNSGTANPTTGTGGVSMSTLSGTLFVAAAVHQDLLDVVSVNFGAVPYANAAPSSFGNLVGTPTAFTVPAVAAAAGYTHTKFFDHFNNSGTVDLANSQAPGFNWYLRADWPAALDGSTVLLTSPPTPANILTISNSVLEISTDVAGQNCNTLGTACASGAGGTSFVGNSFDPSAGFYAECRMLTNAALVNTGSSWPIFWMFNIGTLTGNASFDNWVELDIVEFNQSTVAASGPNYAVHDWTQSTAANNQVFNFYGQVNAQWHVFGLLHVPAASNGGTGLFKLYMDGNLIQTISFSASSGSSPAASPSNPNGIFTEIANNPSYLIYLSAGHNWPAFYDYVGVWTT